MPVSEERTVKVSMICCTAVVPVTVIPFAEESVETFTFVNAAAFDVAGKVPIRPVIDEATTAPVEIANVFKVPTFAMPVDKVAESTPFAWTEDTIIVAVLIVFAWNVETVSKLALPVEKLREVNAPVLLLVAVPIGASTEIAVKEEVSTCALLK